ncbi:MAG: hypothetical protein HZA02_00360 [Nitrospinae bacterium]|nr:hypothetical protein [Nitrospinota bacterium]
MESAEETSGTVQGRLNVLKKSLVSEENSVQYYKTLIDKTPLDTDENVGAARMYGDLREEEKKHVETLSALIDYWERRARELQDSD